MGLYDPYFAFYFSNMFSSMHHDRRKKVLDLLKSYVHKDNLWVEASTVVKIDHTLEEASKCCCGPCRWKLDSNQSYFMGKGNKEGQPIHKPVQSVSKWGVEPWDSIDTNGHEEACKDINVNKYCCEVDEMETNYQCTVSRLAANSNMYSVTIPKESTYGSPFGTCNCGVSQGDGIPCMNMIVLAKRGRINVPGFTRLSMMPIGIWHWSGENNFLKTVCAVEIKVSNW